MNTIQPSIDSSPSGFADWLNDAVGLVQRVNARLRKSPESPKQPALRHGRRVLTNQQCQSLAGLALGGSYPPV
jgi:hypothetical protein